MSESALHVVLCNGATAPASLEGDFRVRSLDYGSTPGRDRNLRLVLPDFVKSAGYIPDRLLDLIELAVYIHAGDRLAGRGSPNAAELHGWQRRFLYRMRVRDYDFWSSEPVKEALSEAVLFMTGDRSYTFEFEPDHTTDRAGLFDKETFEVKADPEPAVSLFSGGLDSLTGAVERLANGTGEVYLVSHAAQTNIKRTQSRLIDALAEGYPGRVKHYRFESRLSGLKAREETQRSRSLLFGSIAYAIAHTAGLRSFYLFENGITGINFPKRQSLMNGRASRTTHPKTVYLLERLFSLVEEEVVSIRNPFLYRTKTDVVRRLKELGHGDLYPSAVSCGVTRARKAPASHCGGCNQCVDRRFAAYAAGVEDYDDGAHYEQDFIRGEVKDAGKKKSLLDFLRQAAHFDNAGPDQFGEKFINELTDLFGYLPEVGRDELETVDKVHALCSRHGSQVWQAYKQMHVLHSSPSQPKPEGNVFSIVGAGKHVRADGHVGEDRHDFPEPFEAPPLIRKLKEIEPGREQAKDFEALMEEIIPALFSPDLEAPHSQVANASRKGIVDLTLVIAASNGFWHHVQRHYGNLAVCFELKNKEALKNSDFDQIAGRLNGRKGQFGVLVGRRIKDFDEEAVRRWLNDGKAVIALDDKDIVDMLRLKERGGSPSEYMREKLRTVLERLG